MSMSSNQAGLVLTLALALVALSSFPTPVESQISPEAPCYSQCNCTVQIINGKPVVVEDCDFKIQLSVPDHDRSATTEDGHIMYLHPNMGCTDSFSIQPTSLDQLKQAVRFALRNNFSVSALVEGHTGTEPICADGVQVDMNKIKHIVFNPEDKQISVGAGMKLADILEAVRAHGRALTGGSRYYDDGSVEGGTIGTSLKEASTLSDQVVSLKFVDMEGNIKQLREGDEDFKSMKVNPGLYGIIYELTLRTM